ASAADAESGVQKVAFPAVSAMSGGGDDSTSPYSSGYSWSSSTSTSGAQSVTVTNNTGLTAISSFTVTPDTTAPTGQTVALSGGPYYSGLSVPLTLGNGSDAGSGVDASSGIVERDSATLSGGSCGTFSGTWTQVAVSGGAGITVQTNHCYHYRYAISDNVGNQSGASAVSADAKVDTGGPTLTLTAPTEVRGNRSQSY